MVVDTWLVATPHEALYAQAQSIAGDLRCDVLLDRGGHHAFSASAHRGILWLLSDGLTAVLTSSDGSEQWTLKIDFLDDALRYRLKHSVRKELLFQAIGARGCTPALTVLDATAGLGRDACMLAHWGCRVQLIERSSVIGTLLRDGLMRARSYDSAAWRMRLTIADAQDVLKSCAEQHRPDVVYIDPMYPLRESSALVRQSMRCLRRIVGDDLDSSAILEQALQVAQQRVVVKRPRHAQSVGPYQPDVILKGRSSRFDVYWAWKKRSRL